MPAMITGIASGSSISRISRPGVAPNRRAASRNDGAMPLSPTTVLRSTGSIE